MRIGLVVPTLGFAGGLERHAHDLALALRARGHFVALLHGDRRGRDPAAFAAAFDRAGPAGAPDATRGLDVAWVEKAASAGELLPLCELPLAIAAHDHDLTCIRTSRMVALGRSPCHRAPGVACVGQGCALAAGRNPFALRGQLQGLAARGPLVACSGYVAARLVDAGAPPEAVQVIHPIPPDDPAPLAARPTERALLAAGQLVHGKGFDLAIDALERLPGATLDVVGEGPSRDALEDRAARRAPGRVRFHGYVPPQRMTSFYDRAAAVLVPSRWPEPFGLVGVEAMRRARPVVAAAHGGIPEWAGPGTFLFAPGDVADLARAAERALADAAAGELALEHARAAFSHAAAVDRAEALLLRLSRAPLREAR